jgi:hypothetical protein
MIDPYHSGQREVTRTAATMIQSKLETWHGSVKTELDAGGTYRVYTGGKHDARNLIATGNVNAREVGELEPASGWRADW